MYNSNKPQLGYNLSGLYYDVKFLEMPMDRHSGFPGLLHNNFFSSGLSYIAELNSCTLEISET